MQLFSTPLKNTYWFLAAATGAILIALAFEHIGGYKPCPLCLQERYAYYLAMPLTVAAIAAQRSGRALWAAIFIAIAGIAFLINSGLGLYHSGVEWHWWPGPTACSGNAELGAGSGNFLESLKNTRVIRCDEAPWRFLGLSFAGWSMIISFFLALFSARLFKQLCRN